MQIIIITSSLKILILDLSNGSNLDKLQKMPVYTLTRLWLKQMQQICKPVDDLIFKKQIIIIASSRWCYKLHMNLVYRSCSGFKIQSRKACWRWDNLKVSIASYSCSHGVVQSFGWLCSRRFQFPLTQFMIPRFREGGVIRIRWWKVYTLS